MSFPEPFPFHRVKGVKGIVMKQLILVFVSLFQIPAFAQNGTFPNGGMCVNCLGLQGPGTFIFWIMLVALFFFILVRFLTNKKNR
jgi:hypothetical protein